MSVDHAVHMTEEQWSTWLKALRSGRYKQAEGMLRERRAHESRPRYCCLGLYCRLNGVDLVKSRRDRYGDAFTWGDEGGVDHAPELLKVAMPYALRATLASMNDADSTFEDIADWLEEAREQGRVVVVEP